jgi:hypothetical protein
LLYWALVVHEEQSPKAEKAGMIMVDGGSVDDLVDPALALFLVDAWSARRILG